MPHLPSWIRSWLILFVACVGAIAAIALPVQAAPVDSYVARYLNAAEPVPIKLNEQGQTRLFSDEDLTKGLRLFSENCKSCHVGGMTLPNPPVSLSLEALKGATPPRDNIDNLVAFSRKPVTYDGSRESYMCREVPDTWLSREQLENLAAFILRAAELGPGWGAKSF